MTRRRRPPFDTPEYRDAAYGRPGRRKQTEDTHPRHLTKGLKRHLRKVEVQNKAEAEKQCALIGVPLTAIAKRPAKKG